MNKWVGKVGVDGEYSRQKEHIILERVWHVLATKECRYGQSPVKSKVAENTFKKKSGKNLDFT